MTDAPNPNPNPNPNPTSAPEARFPSAEEVKRLADKAESAAEVWRSAGGSGSFTEPLSECAGALDRLAPLAAAAEGEEALLEAIAREICCFEGHDPDFQQGATKEGYRDTGRNPAQIIPGWRWFAGGKAKALLPLISAHVAARVADERAEGALRTAIEAEARRYAEFYEPHSDGRNTFVIFADWVRDRALAQQPAPVAEACHHANVLPCTSPIKGFGLFRCEDCGERFDTDPNATPPAPVEAAPDAEGDAMRERIKSAIRTHVHSKSEKFTTALRGVDEAADAILAALPASDAAPAQGEAVAWRHVNATLKETEFVEHVSEKLTLVDIERGWVETPLYAHPAPARTEPSEVEAAVEAEHEACIADCMRAHAEDEALFGREKTGGAEIAAEYIRTRGAGGGA